MRMFSKNIAYIVILINKLTLIESSRGSFLFLFSIACNDCITYLDGKGVIISRNYLRY